MIRRYLLGELVHALVLRPDRHVDFHKDVAARAAVRRRAPACEDESRYKCSCMYKSYYNNLKLRQSA